MMVWVVGFGKGIEGPVRKSMGERKQEMGRSVLLYFQWSGVWSKMESFVVIVIDSANYTAVEESLEARGCWRDN